MIVLMMSRVGNVRSLRELGSRSFREGGSSETSGSFDQRNGKDRSLSGSEETRSCHRMIRSGRIAREDGEKV